MKKSSESSTIRTLNRQVAGLKKALAKAQLEINGLETMIQVREEELKIKIKKRRVTKRPERYLLLTTHLY